MKTKNVKNHPLQSKEWREFRKKMGVKIIEENEFILSIHKIPYLPWTIGYLPKGPMPDKKMIVELEKIGKEEKCIFIQLEPNAPAFTSEEPPLSGVTSEVAEWTPRRWNSEKLSLKPSFHPLFTKYTFILDLTKSEDELLKQMHPKTRYNIKVAQKHGVKVVEDNSDQAFETYLKLTRETTKRQGFYAHSKNYHKTMWETLRAHGAWRVVDRSQLTAHLLVAKYHSPHTTSYVPLVAWVLFVFHDTLYYPYGASSTEHRETMASNLMMWEGIRFGKKLGLKKFDMWGALGPNPNPKDSWYGFHRFKEGYGGVLVEFVGSFDLVINPVLYHFYKIADKLRWFILKLKTFN